MEYMNLKGDFMSTLNRNFIMVFMVSVIVLFIGCTKETASYEPTIKDIALETSSTDLETVSRQIMVKLFEEYKKDSVKKELRIKDYTINKINDLQGNSDKFKFSIDYSLKPMDLNSYVLAGDGKIKKSWIVNKFAFVEVQRIGKVYKINSMATGRWFILFIES